MLKADITLTFKTMLSLLPHHIIDIYVLVDDTIPKISRPRGGRPTILSDSELITILIWNTLVVRQKTLKDIHTWIQMYHPHDFPSFPKYPAFVQHCHRVTPILHQFLTQLLSFQSPLRFMDSTMIEVCRQVRANSHKVAKGIAQFGKNHQGWHYGFKLHTSVDAKGRLAAVVLTPANVYDAQMMPDILNKYTKIGVGDSHYGASVMRQHIWERYGTIIIAPPHFKQKKKVMTQWQHLLLTMRPKIESVFDYLKEHLHLVSSFPRSVKGYLLHYMRILLGYQVLMLTND